MRSIHVALVPDEIPESGLQHNQAVLVIDVLRASTTIITALAAGAVCVVPVAEIEEANRMAANIGTGALLGGERSGLRPTGFLLGNSPLEYTLQTVGGRTVVLTTTNGTYTLARCKGAGAIAVASFRNAAASARWAGAQLALGRELIVVCAGTRRRFTLEDACLAGLLTQLIQAGAEAAGAEVAGVNAAGAVGADAAGAVGADAVLLSDGAQAAQLIWQGWKQDPVAVMHASAHGQDLARMGFQVDLDFCAQVSVVDIVPQLLNGRLQSV